MDKLVLTSSRVLKGSMKFTPKIGKKDRVKKGKKVQKGLNSENKKVLKKNVTKKSNTNESQQQEQQINNKNILDTKNTEDILKANEIIKNIDVINNDNNNKSITVNTIDKNDSIINKEDNSIIKLKESQINSISKNVSPSKEKIALSVNQPNIVKEKLTTTDKINNDKKNQNKVGNVKKNMIKKNEILNNNKTENITKLINKKYNEILEDEDDTISEISDEFLRANNLELKDSIVDSSNDENEKDNKHEYERDTIAKKNIQIEKNNQDNEDKTLVEEAENSDSNRSDNEPSSEMADETLIIEDSQKIQEYNDEDQKSIKKNNNNKEGQPIKNSITIADLIARKDNNKKNNKGKKGKKELTDSIYELLDQEEFNQSIEAEIYNKPINHNDAEIEKIVKEKITPKKRVGRPPKNNKKKEKKSIQTKKSVEVIVISDDEEDGTTRKIIDENMKNTIIKTEDEDEVSNKIKNEEKISETQIISSKESSEIIKNSRKRLNNNENEDENDISDDQENLMRKIKRLRSMAKGANEQSEIENINENNEINNDDNENNNNDNNKEQEQIEKQEKITKEKTSKKSKRSKSKTTKNTKSTKILRSSKIREDVESNENNPGNQESVTTSANSRENVQEYYKEHEHEKEQQELELEKEKEKKKLRKRKSPSPRKSPKKKKLNHSELGMNSSSDEEESENVNILSRTIADIIDNYRGTEISTTQKEIYRLAALKRKATLDRKRGRLTTPEIVTTTVPEKKEDENKEKKPKVYDPEKNKTAIQMRVVNGEIVIDQQSTLIDHIDTTDEALPILKYDENNHITSASFKPKLKPLKWTKEETELFYKCLSIFGTNFSMLAIMFPSRNRKQLLNKYKNEEKNNPGHVKYALKHKKSLDPEFFEKYSGQNMMEIGREAVEKVKLIEEQRKKDDMELFNTKKKENDNDIKRVMIKNESFCDVKDTKPILAN